MVAQHKGIWVADLVAGQPVSIGYGLAHRDNSVAGSSWSKMADGRWMVCTSVHIIVTNDNDFNDDEGWSPRACY